MKLPIGRHGLPTIVLNPRNRRNGGQSLYASCEGKTSLARGSSKIYTGGTLTCSQLAARRFLPTVGACDEFHPTRVLAPVLSEPKARSRAPTRRLCDGVRRSRPRAASPSTRRRQPRSAAAASFARCAIVKKLLNGKVAARGRAVEPDEAGATNEEL
jgi:hypothetical protein